MKRFLFSQPDNAPLYDTKLPQTAYRLYNILVDIADKKTHQIDIEVRRLAMRLDRSIRTTRRNLSLLVSMGIIGRIFHKSKISKKNLSNTFIVFGRHAKRYENTEYAGDYQFEWGTKMSVPTDKNGTQNKERDSLRKNKNLTLKREARTPLPDEYAKKRKQQAITLALKDVPDILKTTAEYMLQKTGRFHITKHEIEILRSLAENHTPVRIQKEIDKCYQRFIQHNKNLHQLTFSYIGACLANQRSLVRKKKSSESHVEASVTIRETEQTQEYLMTLEEAQQVVSEYETVKPEQESVTPETKEFYTRIKTVHDEKVKKCDEYMESLPRDEYGCYIFPQDEKDAPDWEITLEEYLKLKYPEAEEEELRIDDIRDQHGLEEAKKIDTACATCKSPDNCLLPEKYKIGGTRPLAILEGSPNSKKRVNIRYGGCIKCKHGEPKQRKQSNPEFDSRVKKSGLTEAQIQQTFETHDHRNALPEIVIAKAQAILAVKQNRSLILAGKAGTGKTHLAVSIAIETMKQGRQALFRNVPELLDELRERARNYDDFYHTLRKYKDVPCLVLDDLGKEKTTQAGIDYLYQIIDARYRNGLQTIITTNALNMEGLTNRWNENAIEPLISRLLENGTWVTIRETGNYRMIGKMKHDPEPPIKAKAVNKPEQEAMPLREYLHVEVKDDRPCLRNCTMNCVKRE